MGSNLTKEQEDFSALFSLTPNIHILDLNNGCDDITKLLNSLVPNYNGDITTVQSQFLAEQKVKIKRSNYDYGVICNSILDNNDKQALMKVVTMAIRDSGYIIITEKRDKPLDEIYGLLEEFDFGAVNAIDIFETHSLIMAKKLHMWGMD